jgi:hypothetical protein
VSQDESTLEQAQAVRKAHEAELLRRANVVGVGVGLRTQGGRRQPQVALVIMVRQKIPRALLAEADVLPVEIEGVPVDVVEVGDITAG